MWGLFTLAPIMSKYVEPALQGSLGNCRSSECYFRGRHWASIF
jgi:hypothetical protein